MRNFLLLLKGYCIASICFMLGLVSFLHVIICEVSVFDYVFDHVLFIFGITFGPYKLIDTIITHVKLRKDEHNKIG